MFIIYIFFDFSRVKFIDNTYITSNSHPVELFVIDGLHTVTLPQFQLIFVTCLLTNSCSQTQSMNIKYYICIINSHEQKGDNSKGIWGNNRNIMRLHYEVTPLRISRCEVLCLWSLHHCSIYWNLLKDMILRKKIYFIWNMWLNILYKV